jgi:RNA polymerase sigma-70 factor (ECF subfamily)
LADPDRVESARHGDAAAFESLVEARVGPMLRTAMAILGQEDTARDAVQDALLSAWRDVRSLRDPRAFDPWLTRILVNRCRRLGRGLSERRARETRLEGTVGGAAEPAGFDLAALDERHALEAAFERLTFDDRTILVLHHLDGRPVAEVADALEIPEGTAKSRLFAARHALEAAMDKEAAP